MLKLIVFYLILSIHHVLGSRCRYDTVQGIYLADCMNCGFEEVPTNLEKSIQALNLASNEIRALYNDSFSNYGSLKLLYLENNNIKPIESHTFAPLTNLETLDLSKADITTFSNLHFPKNLRKLYLDNRNFVVTEIPLNHLEKLTFVSVSGSWLDRVPFFGGAFPNLKALNLTKNKLENFKTDDLAHLCKLENLYLTSPLKLNDPCECDRLKRWTTEHNINVKPSSFCISLNSEKCDSQPSNTTLENYDACLKESTKREIYHLVYIGGGIAVGIFTCIMLYLCCTRRKSCCKLCCCRKDKLITVKT